MRCHHVEPLLSDRLERSLPAREAEAVAAHLRDCAACRRRADDFAAAGADLRSLAERIVPPDLERPIAERWLAEREAVEPRPGRTADSREGWSPRAVPQQPKLVPTFGVSRPLAPGWCAACGVAAALLLVMLARPLAHQGRRRTPKPSSPLAARVQRPSPALPGASPNSPLGDSDLADPRVARSTNRSHGRGPAAASVQPALAATREHAPAIARSPSPSVADELTRLNDDASRTAWRWAMPAWDQREPDEARTRHLAVGDDFVQVPFPRLADLAGRQIAAAVESYQREVAVVDTRLTCSVTLQQKAIALDDLCQRLRADTGIQLAAGSSVAEEKVTIFCEKLPLREVMRQLSRPFGYTWLRSGKTGEYKYELVQDLRSQLLEEELRNRDRNAALLDIDREMSQYRSYLGLSPAELRARAARNDPNAPKLPKHFAGTGWGPLQLYSRLSPRDVAALRAGEQVSFSVAPQAGEQQLPPDLVRGVLESVSDRRIRRRGDGFEVGPAAALPDGLPPASVPEARARVTLQLDRSELGQLTLVGRSGFMVGTPPDCPMILGDDGPIAVGVSPTVRNPDNAVANAKLALDPTLRTRVTVRPPSSCTGDLSPGPSPKRGGVPDAGHGLPHPKGFSSQHGDRGDKLPLPASGRGSGGEVNAGEVPPPKVTTADVLEAMHHATGLPIVADYYTHLYPASELSVQNMPLFDALNRLADPMRLRWTKAGNWLQFRSAGYFNDRLKEVPNRLLARWAASRRQHGALTLDDLVEIAQLSDAQLDSEVVAEGAQSCLGLTEWTLARNGFLRPNWRYLAMLTPAQRVEVASATGLPFRRMTLAQQQEFMAPAFSGGSETASAALEDLAEATLRVDYRLPDSFEWKSPAVAGAAGWRGLMPSPVCERTPEEALRAARGIDAHADATQIVPTELTVTMIYRFGGPNARLTPLVIRADPHGTLGAPPRRSAAKS
jgi:hypothetical protein